MSNDKQMIAIDLGTTHSLVGVYQEGQIRLIENVYGQLKTPSAVALDEHGEVLIGQAALELRYQGREVLTSFKRLMGTDHRLTLGKKKFSAVELSALILSSLKKDVESALQCEVDEAVITVPAYFNDIQRQATIQAAELAGLKVSRLINEPTAAALAYGLAQEDESCFLVVDLGGGTFDVSIVELFDGVIEVRASAGDNSLGGIDFVQTIVNQFWQKHGKTFQTDDGLIPHDIQVALGAKAQEAMHRLTSEEQTVMQFQWQGQTFEFAIHRDDFNQWIDILLGRLQQPLERALRDARIRPNEIDQIVMVGGATRIPAVRKLVTKLFGRFPLTNIQPDEAIVRGACVQVGLKNKDEHLKEIVLTDVCPFSLGIAVGEEGRFDPIIERNTVIPCSRVNTYTAMHKGQRQITVQVYQGEHRLCKENVLLGDIQVELPQNNDYLSIEVRFSYNPSGVLDVDVYVPSTEQTIQKVLINHKSVMTAEQIEQARQVLAELKIHPRDTMLNKALLLRAERLYTEHTGVLRQQISERTSQFNEVLETQDDRYIRHFRKLFEHFLNDVENMHIFDDY